MREWKDRLGIFASVACAIHCAATPVLVATLPTLKLTEWMIDPKFHQVIAIVCSAFVALAIWPAFLRYRDYHVLTLSTAGLGLILSAAFLMPDTCCTLHNPSTSSISHHDHDHDGHSHAGHMHAAHSQEVQDAQSDAKSSPQVVMAGVGMVQPWMTPVGGVLLILAHAMNLRRRIYCCESCCVGATSTDATSAHGEIGVLPLPSEACELTQSLARAS